MVEVVGILIAVGALLGGLLLLGWAFGDFQPRRGGSSPETKPEEKPA
ncbi:MAG: hypothetical protein HYY90_01380 [Candidatus Omnitrophica bacterium]|nr:hypothetical protein [Candidatus Omnitrophota bacterium]MBI3083007.1 hypothetical protein [Candidatus Omnitrophota bacterium]